MIEKMRHAERRAEETYPPPSDRASVPLGQRNVQLRAGYVQGYLDRDSEEPFDEHRTPGVLMKYGLYRNTLGAELVVTQVVMRTSTHLSLGHIYEAEARDHFFGTTRYLVTVESMRDSGYELIEEQEN